MSTATNGTYISLYERRVKLVADALAGHSKLDEKTAMKVAVHVLYALDHIPEEVRYNRR
jgi:hypothetical protein